MIDAFRRLQHRAGAGPKSDDPAFHRLVTLRVRASVW